VLRVAASVAAAVLMLAGCSGDPEEGQTRLERALRGLGAGVSATGSGFGWADLQELRPDSLDPGFAADALGPGADDLLDDAAQILAATGMDPDAASSAVAIGGSYALGARLDGVAPGHLPELLRRAGARERREGSWTYFDLGKQADSVTAGPLRPFGALVSRTAVGPDGVVLARFDAARTSLTGEGGELDLAGTRVEPALECLGEVAAARLIPGTFTHNPAASPELIAMGVRSPRDREPPREVLCAVDDSEERADARAAALEAAFAEGASDPVTGRPMAALAPASEVGIERDGEHWLTRVELAPPEGAEPGFLFAGFVRGSVLTYLGAARPVPRER
jgi:hypothetical protein